MKPGDAARVRCVVATTRDSLKTVRRKREFLPVAPFRNVKNKAVKSARLPDGVYRVRAANEYFNGRDHDTFVETNIIRVRISGRREQSDAPDRNGGRN